MPPKLFRSFRTPWHALQPPSSTIGAREKRETEEGAKRAGLPDKEKSQLLLRKIFCFHSSCCSSLEYFYGWLSKRFARSTVEWSWVFLNSGASSVTWVSRIIHQVQMSSLGASDNVNFYFTTLSQVLTLRLVVPYLSVTLYIRTSILGTLRFEKRSWYYIFGADPTPESLEPSHTGNKISTLYIWRTS